LRKSLRERSHRTGERVGRTRKPREMLELRRERSQSSGSGRCGKALGLAADRRRVDRPGGGRQPFLPRPDDGTNAPEELGVPYWQPARVKRPTHRRKA
jgi:hypothetical protein